MLRYRTDETDDGDEIERTIELVEDNAAGPEDIVLAMKDEERRRELFGRARAVVKDPRYLEAAMLFFCENWQIRSKDPNKGSLERHFGATDSQIRHWIIVLGSTIGSLGKLEKKGLVESRRANPETEPEHTGRRYFMATMAGERALAYARATSRTVDGFLGGLA